MWVARAKAEHDLFRGDARPRRGGVRGRGRCWPQALAKPGGQGVGVREHPVRAPGRHHRRDPGPGMGRVGGPGGGGGVPDRRDHQGGRQRDVGLVWESAEPTTMLLPPLPNFLFQRDPSCWIFDGVTINPMTKPARKPETMIMEVIYRFHPMFAAEEFPDLAGRLDENWGRCHVEGGDVQPIGNGTVMIGMGERTTPQAVLGSPVAVPRRIGDPGARRAPPNPGLHAPGYGHHDVRPGPGPLFPQVVYGARTWAIRPGESAEGLVTEAQPRGRFPGGRGGAGDREDQGAGDPATRWGPSGSSGTTATTSSRSRPG